MLSHKNLFLVLLGTLLGILVSVGGSVFAERESGETAAIPFDELRTFTEVFGRIQKDYVEEVSDKKLLEDAIRGMLSGLDPHSTYLDTDQFKELQVGTTGRFGGLGIEVGMEDGFVKVISPIDDTPADRAGVKAGDLIIRLDEKPVKGMTLGEAVKIMRGKPGEEILLTIIREGTEQPLKITIVRDIIKVKSVKSRMLDDGYGYIRVSSFQSKSGESVKEALSELKKKHPLKGVVLDLRNNPGGVLNAAVEISDIFLNSGLIVYTEGRLKDSELKFKATPGDMLSNAPMVVLINAGSASASEIVAGALQDHKRAVIMGEKSFGKGSVQTILPTNAGGAVKMTTARYYTPSGRSIQAEGIEPDIPLSRVKLEKLKHSDFKPVKEADLSHHLSNGNAKKKKKESKKDPFKTDLSKKDLDALLLQDYPLSEALNLLKGIAILQSNKGGF
ncbi:MAG: S41 family peptidase [Methylococcales bacterium]